MAKAASDSSWLCSADASICACDRSCRKYVCRSVSASGSRPSRASFARRAASWPVLAHHSPGVSPGRGIIPLTSTRRDTGRRGQTSGAVNPPRDCPTTTRSVRSPTASTTVSTYSGRPARTSSPGRSTETTSRPRRPSSSLTPCQYQAEPCGSGDQHVRGHGAPSTMGPSVVCVTVAVTTVLSLTVVPRGTHRMSTGLSLDSNGKRRRKSSAASSRVQKETPSWAET